MAVVTRYAPSPTGALHIGGARTALFNWALARHSGGSFLLRIEDTDRARSTRESEDAVLEALRWLGLDHDPVPGFETIPRQSERLERYREVVEELLRGGHAYRCTCTPEAFESMRQAALSVGRQPGYDGTCRDKGTGASPGRPFCVRLRVPEDGPTRWRDLVAGPSGQNVSELDDFVIARTDGTPIYHLAVVVDDHEMSVTHVLRGREHMTSTPRQLLLYAALGFEPPEFAHVPLLVDARGKKLSKRQDSVSIQSYRDRGFTPEAVLNFIARLGWAHGDLEVFTRAELVKLFSLDGIGKAPAQVQEDKLFWLSQHYIKTLALSELLTYLQPFLDATAGRSVPREPALEKLVDLLRERSKTLAELAERARFYLLDEIEIDAKAARKHYKPAVAAPLASLHSALTILPDWSEAALQGAFEQVLASHDGLKLGTLAQPVRVAVVGSPASPGIFETLEILGRERSLVRLDAALLRMRAQAED